MQLTWSRQCVSLGAGVLQLSLQDLCKETRLRMSSFSEPDELTRTWRAICSGQPLMSFVLRLCGCRSLAGLKSPTSPQELPTRASRAASRA